MEIHYCQHNYIPLSMLIFCFSICNTKTNSTENGTHTPQNTQKPKSYGVGGQKKPKKGLDNVDAEIESANSVQVDILNT